MKMSDFLRVLLLMAIGVSLLFMGMMIIFIVIDSVTSREIGEESIPCIDKNGNPFRDEVCTETIYCSKFGLVSFEKCVNVATGEEVKE